MKLRIIQLEDSVMKHSVISRVIKNVVPAEIDWVTDMYSGIKKLMKHIEAESHMIWQLQICIIHCPQAVRLTGRWEIYLLIL